MFGLGGGEVLVILVIALIILGPKKIPELAKGLGRGIREFQKAKNDFLHDVDESPAQKNSAITSQNEEKVAPPVSVGEKKIDVEASSTSHV